MSEIKIHELKIAYEYGVAKLDGKKLFEIRKNDRDFKVGDLVHYTLLPSDKRYAYAELDDNKDNIKYAMQFYIEQNIEKMDRKLYRITYITDYAQQDGYVVFGEEEVAEL